MTALSFRGVFRVWVRFGRMVVRHPLGQAVNILVSPAIAMLLYGLGIGSLVSSVEYHGIAVSYGSFALAGIVAMGASFSGFFHGSYGGFFHMHYERLHQLIITSPITLEEMVFGEILWMATQAALAGTGALLVGVVCGFAHIAMLPYGVLAAFLIGWVFSSFGLICAAAVERIAQLEYTINLILLPVLYISGAFFPLERMPSWLQWIARILPLYDLISLSRCGLLGVPVDWISLFIPLGWILLLTTVSVRWVRRRIAS